MSDADEFAEIIDEFLVESHENLDRLDNELVALEADPDPDVLASIFRTIHTIKGTSGFLGFGVLERLTHAGEFLLSKLRDGELPVTQENTSALLRMVDVVRELLAAIQATGSDDADIDIAPLVADLERLQEPATTAPPPVPAAAPKATFGDLLVERGLVDADAVAEAVAMQEAGDPRRIGELLVANGHLAPEAVAETLKTQEDVRAQGPAETSVRVDVALLDNLMNLVGELVLARNQVLQFTNKSDDPVLAGASQRLDRITTELQEGVMKTRMQTIDSIWSRLPRVVRDLAVGSGKQIRVEMQGRETELDRTIIEAIKDPLTHLIRNAVDHGLESPADRTAAGKDPEGTITLRAFHEGGQVNIEIVDDGRGLDHDRILDKAVERQLVSPFEAAQLSDRAIAHLIFEPGFSTADEVTNVSGRGVGMDVVKTNVEAIGGTIDVTTRPGAGTAFRIKIPLTLAIIPALLIRCDDGHFAIPQMSLLELLRVDTREDPIECIAGTPVYRLRGELLPIVRLASVFADTDDHGIAARQGIVNIVVVQAEGHAFGLVVDDILDTAEIVVKPLGAGLKHIPIFAGATIMGDGRVALILDVPGVAAAAATHPVRDRTAAVATAGGTESSTRRTLLMTRIGDRPAAILLDLVARLEEIPTDQIEAAGRHAVVQYRDEILPLVFLDEELGRGRSELTKSTIAVIVHTIGETSVGLVVDQIHDIVEQELELDRISVEPGLLGTAVVQGRVVDVVDARSIVEHALPARLGKVTA